MVVRLQSREAFLVLKILIFEKLIISYNYSRIIKSAFTYQFIASSNFLRIKGENFSLWLSHCILKLYNYEWIQLSRRKYSNIILVNLKLGSRKCMYMQLLLTIQKYAKIQIRKHDRSFERFNVSAFQLVRELHSHFCVLLNALYQHWQR